MKILAQSLGNATVSNIISFLLLVKGGCAVPALNSEALASPANTLKITKAVSHLYEPQTATKIASDDAQVEERSRERARGIHSSSAPIPQPAPEPFRTSGAW